MGRRRSAVLVQLASLRFLWRHPAQLCASVLGVALGVAALLGIELAIESTTRSLERSTRASSGAATHAIRGGPSELDERLYATLARVADRVLLAPVIERACSIGADPPIELSLVGVDPLRESKMRPGLADAAGALRAGGDVPPVLLAASVAERIGARPGDRFELTVGARVREVELAGTLSAGDPASASLLEGLAITDVGWAQDLAGASGVLTRIDLRAPADPAGAAELERLTASLPAGATIERAEQRAAELADMSRAFEFNLRMLALLALIVGVFLVYSSATFAVLARRELFGALRALGATRGEIFRAIAGEALWVGALGTAAGIGLGLAFARALLPIFERTINDLYYAVEVERLTISPALLVRSALLGLVATQLGALAPALEATRVPPRLALARSFAEQSAERGGRRLAWVGAALLAGSGATLALAPRGLGAGYVALFGVFFAAAAFAPLYTRSIARALAAPLGAAFGHLGRLAARTVERSLSRTAVAVAALAVALGAAFSIATMIASLRTTVLDWLERSLIADVFVSAPHRVGSRNDATLEPAVFERALAAAGGATYTTFRGLELESDRGSVFCGAIGGERETVRAGHELIGGNADATWSSFESGQGAIASESLARRLDLDVGDRLTLRSPRGPRAFEIAGLYRDYSSERGLLLIASSAFVESWNDARVSSIGFRAGVRTSDELAAALRDALRGEPARVRTDQDVRAATLTVFERTFAVARALELVATLVAVVACVSSLMALVLERGREFALLRAEGLTPRGALKLVMLESSLVGGIAALYALPLGVALSAMLVHVINPRAFGWTVRWSIEPRACVETIVLALAAALVAGLWPAWRLTRAQPSEALRAD